MRYVALSLGLGSLAAVLAGCSGTRWGVINNGGKDTQAGVSPQVPTVAALVRYMDDNAQRVGGIRCADGELTVSQGWKSIPLPCSVACQRSRNFRLTARMISSTEVDLGSNKDEFWYWIKKGEPYQFHCSYQALQEGRVRVMPFPFQPDWVAEALGLGNYGPAERYTLTAEPTKLKLVEYVVGPQRNKLRKVIVFERREARNGEPQITDYLLIDDATNKLICSAHVSEVQGNLTTTGVVPRRIKLSWPAEKVELTMRLNRAEFNPQFQPQLFVRSPMPNVPSFDLASGRPDGQLNAFQRVGGTR
jgi:hypothetical protein